MQLYGITEEIMGLIVEFCNKGPRDLLSKPIEVERYVQEVREWELEFFNYFSFETVQELLIAASFLNNEVLIDACSAYIAYKLKHKSLEELLKPYKAVPKIDQETSNSLMDKYKYLVMKDFSAYEEALK